MEGADDIVLLGLMWRRQMQAVGAGRIRIAYWVDEEAIRIVWWPFFHLFLSFFPTTKYHTHPFFVAHGLQIVDNTSKPSSGTQH